MNRIGCARGTVAFTLGGLLLAGLLGCRVTIGHTDDDSREHEHAGANVCVDCGVGHQGSCVAAACHGRLDDLCHGYESTRWRPLGDYCDDGGQVVAGPSYNRKVDSPPDVVPDMGGLEELDGQDPLDSPAPDEVPPPSLEPELDLPDPMPMPDTLDAQPGGVDADPPMQTRRRSPAAQALFAAVRRGLGQTVAAPRQTLRAAGLSVSAADTFPPHANPSTVPLQVTDESLPHHRSSDDDVRLIHYISID